jgi:hypothetical protein
MISRDWNKNVVERAQVTFLTKCFSFHPKAVADLYVPVANPQACSAQTDPIQMLLAGDGKFHNSGAF